jgi:RNA polymerase subunit RPABC4/transcription elongation factor Spt4
MSQLLYIFRRVCRECAHVEYGNGRAACPDCGVQMTAQDLAGAIVVDDDAEGDG